MSSRFNTDDGIRRATMIHLRGKDELVRRFNTDDGIRRATIRQLGRYRSR